MKYNILPSLLLSFLFSSLASAACSRDNCYRALAATSTKASAFCSTYTKTPNTATAIPTYGSLCSNSPSKVSSACSCVLTSTTTTTSTPTPTCVPTPVINATNYGNGNFENYPPPGQGAVNIQPPWYFNGRDSENAFGQYEIEPVGSGYGGTVAVFHLFAYDSSPTSLQRLQQPISYCNNTSYAFSLYARQPLPQAAQCNLTVYTDFLGNIATFSSPAFGNQFQKFGPVVKRISRAAGSEGDGKGGFEDLLTIEVSCEGGGGRDLKFEVDSVRVVPA